MTLVQGDLPGTDHRARRGALLRLLAAAALVLGWAVHLVASFVGGYESVPWATLEHEQHRVTSVSVMTSDPYPSGPWWTTTEPRGTRITDRSDLADGNPWQVIYTVRDAQRVRVADPQHGAFGPPSSTSGWSSEPSGEELLDALLARGLPAVGTGEMPSAWRVSQVSGLALALGTLVLVVAGPRPVHGNRWFWFWIVQLPAALGVLAYAAYELGGRGRARAAAAPERREGGGWGFVRLAAGHVVIGLVLSLLAMLLGTTVVPL